MIACSRGRLSLRKASSCDREFILNHGRSIRVVEVPEAFAFDTILEVHIVIEAFGFGYSFIRTEIIYNISWEDFSGFDSNLTLTMSRSKLKRNLS